MSDTADMADAESERVLALRVLEQAIRDATSTTIPAGRARSQCRPLVREKEEAQRFLCAPDGEWAAARIWWCDLAGVSAEWLQRRLE